MTAMSRVVNGNVMLVIVAASGDQPGELTCRQLGGVDAGHPDRAVLWGEQAEHAAQQRGLPGAVGPEQGAHVGLAHARRDVGEPVSTTPVAEPQPGDFDPSQPLATRPGQQRHEKGCADQRGEDAQRQVHRGRAAGDVIHGEQVSGSEQRRDGQQPANDGPPMNRARCGTTSPTQPMIPAILTTVAVIRVVAATTRSHTRRRFTPNVWASSSPAASTVNGQRTA